MTTTIIIVAIFALFVLANGRHFYWEFENWLDDRRLARKVRESERRND